MIPVPGFEGRRVAVFGLGRSGLTAARALKAGGALPVLWDDSVSSRMQAQAEGFDVEDLTSADWSGFAALVLSPGAPLTHPEPHWTVGKAKAAGVEIVGDIELFARAIAALPEGERPAVIAITGTNGKSTTTALIGWVLKQAGCKVAVGGNIGIGVLALPPPTEVDFYVLEVSSYQLDLTKTFTPRAAILTNISPDHLERHGGMEGYVAAKRRIFQDPQTAPYLGVDEPETEAIWRALVAEGRAVDPVSVNRPMTNDLGMYLLDGWLAYNAGGQPAKIVDLSQARSLAGRHNAQNAALAFLAITDLGIPEETVAPALLSFPGLAHRMEHVATLGRIRFINDSKATNADAARQALSSYERSFWIAGGRAKAGGIDDLEDLFPRVVEAFLIGEAAGAFAARLGDTPHRTCGDMASAVKAAAEAAAATGRDEVVLLSPAAASFDQYPDFEARGEAFRAAVLALGAVPASAS
ncbi:MAG: UDP-N-acetylmuramoyl-L-alanine--D-glutamate ligase [Brevundimonas sp.]|uniref:UDP-N-acetylmuramoyl-L-alanine--D-glutamate ligase n=1 Tax=Brevundimonas sp. TaxID=1871086 RepID=UPI00391BB640